MPLQKRQHPKATINLLDFGFEDAKGLAYFASKRRHKNKKFMGIGWTKQKGLITRRRNLKLVWGDALSKARRIPSESVKIVTSDFLFSEFKVGGADLTALGRFFEEVTQKMRIELAKQINRILVPNGRFVVTEYNQNIPPMQSVLAAAGFSYTVKPLPETKFNRTKFLEMISAKLRTNPDLLNQMRPMQIIARKK